MLNQALLTFSPLLPIYHTHCHRQNPIICRSVSSNVSRLNGGVNMGFWRGRNRGLLFPASSGQSSTVNMEKKRKVVEHICLLKGKKELLDEEEKDMLDYLFTSQYQMRGILAISLGRISDGNVENFTHAVYMRFQRKEDVAKFYENPFYLGVLKEHVMPYCHVCPDMA